MSFSGITSWRLQVVLVCVLAALVQLAGLGRHFSTRGEPREALVSQSMLSSGDWILPRAYGGGVPSKPPFTHWLMSSCALVLGELNELASRLPSVLASTALLCGLFVFLHRRYGQSCAVLTVLVLCTCIEWFRAATSARVDAVFAACLSGALLMLYRWGERNYGGFPILMIALLACAALAKGPVAIVLCGAIFFIWSWMQRESITRTIARSCMVFIPVVLIASLWYVLAYLARPEEFLEKVWYENIARFTSQQDDEPHKKSVLFLYSSILLGLLPWVVLIVPAAKTLWPLSWARLRGWWSRLDSFSRYGWVSSLLVILFFSIPAGKRSVYLLPIYPFLCFFVSRAILEFSTDRVREFFVRVLACTAVVVVLLFIAFSQESLQSLVIARLGSRAAVEFAFFSSVLKALEETSSLSYYSALTLLAVLALWAVFKRFHAGTSALVRFGTLVVTLFVFGNGVVFPKIAHKLSGEEFAVFLKDAPKLYSYGTEFYGLSYYSGRPILRLEEHPGSSGQVVLNAGDLKALERQLENLQNVTILRTSEAGITKPSAKVMLVEVAPIKP